MSFQKMQVRIKEIKLLVCCVILFWIIQNADICQERQDFTIFIILLLLLYYFTYCSVKDDFHD